MLLAARHVRSNSGPLIGAASFLLALSAFAAGPWTDVKPQAETVVGSLSCMSASCHGGTQTAGAVTSRQSVHWLRTSAKYSDGRQFYDPRARLASTDADPHALAAQRMLETPFQ